MIVLIYNKINKCGAYQSTSNLYSCIKPLDNFNRPFLSQFFIPNIPLLTFHRNHIHVAVFLSYVSVIWIAHLNDKAVTIHTPTPFKNKHYGSYKQETHAVIISIYVNNISLSHSSYFSKFKNNHCVVLLLLLSPVTKLLPFLLLILFVFLKTYQYETSCFKVRIIFS